MQHIWVITIGRSFLQHLFAFWHSRRRICRPTAKFVAPILNSQLPFWHRRPPLCLLPANIYFICPPRLQLPSPPLAFPYRHSRWRRKSILFPDVGSSYFAAASLPLFSSSPSLLFVFVFIPLSLCLALPRSVCFSAVSLGNIFQYLHVNHEKHVKFVCLVKTSLLRRALDGGRGRGLPLIGLGNKA